METWETLSFGRYTGRVVEDVWTGINPFNDNDIINKYLHELCFFLLNINDIQEIPSSKFNLHADNNEIVFFSQSNTPKTIVIDDDKIHITCEDQQIPIALFIILSNILSDSFKTIPQYYTKSPIGKSVGHSINSIRFQLLQADPGYIQWCIENVPFFFFKPSGLEDLCSKECRHLTNFEFSRFSDNIFLLNQFSNTPNFYCQLQRYKRIMRSFFKIVKVMMVRFTIYHPYTFLTI